MSNLITEGTYNVMDSNNKKEYEDSKGVTRIRKSKDRKHNGQKKKDKQLSIE
jgi:hypothetical protein